MSVVANVAINVDSRGVTQKLREVQSQATATERAIGGLGGAIGKLAAAFSVVQAARFVFVKTAEIESQTRSLQVLTGSAEKAGQIIKDLQQLGAATPFTSTELIDAAKRLQAFGVETDKVVETTRRLADVSGATGAELQGLVTAYGQVQAKGRLQGEELLQFQERGVALQKVLREEYQLSGEEFQDALEKGRISAQAVEYAIQKLTAAGGQYADGAIAQSDTLAGKFSTLQDSIQNLASRLGTILAPAMQSILGLAIDIANQINSVFETILLQRQLGANLSGQQRNKLFQQAESEALKITTGRFGVDIFGRPKNQSDFTNLREERFRDLMRTYGYQQGILKPPSAKTPTPAVTLPGLLGATGGKGGKGGKSDAERAAEIAAREAERAAEAAKKELERVTEIIQTRTAEAQLIRLKSELQDKILAAEAANDPMLAARLRGEERELEIMKQLAQETQKETDTRAKQAIIFEAQTKFVANQREIQRELNELQRVADQERFDALKKHIEQQYTLNEGVKRQQELADGIANTLGQSIGSAFDSLIAGSEAWGESLRKIASGVLIEIAKQLLQIFVIEQAINALRNLLTPFSAATPIGAGGGQIGRFGTLGPNYGIPQRAKGGPVGGGRPYLVGERGPELFVPGRSGNIVPNNKLGGDNVSVVVNVDAKGTNVQGNNQTGNELGRVISAAVQQELIKQKRPGGLLA